MSRELPRSLVLALLAGACGDSARESADAGASESVSVSVTQDPPTSAPTSAPTSTPGETGSSGGSVSATGSSGPELTGTSSTADPSGDPGTTGAKFDVGDAGTDTVDPSTTTGAPVDLCKVQDDMNAIGECDKEAPPNSFEPEIQWAWTGPNGDAFSIVTPLVANLTDDNADGTIDLCDVPDVVVVASPSSGQPGVAGHIYVLDGLTGTLHFQIADPVDHTVTPAIGDIDNDGLPEIVTTIVGGNPVVFEHDGVKKWTSPSNWPEVYSGSIALADADNDGDVEILAGNRLFDHNGALLFTAPQPAGNWSSSAFADLNGDKDQEIVLGHAAFHHDGQLYYVTGVGPGYPSIANLDQDPEPEVLVTNMNGLSLINHDGSVIYQDQRPTGDFPGGTTWLRPSTVHDFDGDGKSEYATSSANNYTTYKPLGPQNLPTILWKAAVSDQSGIAAGTAFDFLGDGVAEAMYADEHFMFIFDGAGKVLLQIPRSSGTLSEYPIVADIDNDGSAEIVVVSCQYQQPQSPTVQVIRDKMDRWIQARRIWNQHTYHVTNVREDGTIPQFEAPSWKQLNTYRTNSQIEGGGLCKPPIPQ